MVNKPARNNMTVKPAPVPAPVPLPLPVTPVPRNLIVKPIQLTNNEIRRAMKERPAQRKRTMKNGGARGETCVSILLKVLPKEDDYQRMVDNNCSAIDVSRTYREFVMDQRLKADGLDEEDCDFLLALCRRVLKKRVSHVDLEPCSNFPTTKVFLDRVNNFVTVNDR